MNDRLTGLIAAPFTPFDDSGDLALQRVPEYAHWLASNGVAGAFVAGTTGEGLSMTIDERKRLAEAWIAAAPDDFRIIVHVGHTCLRDCQELASHAQRSGARATGAMAPCFFRPASIGDLVDWCAAVAAAAPELPFYYYHIPSMTGVDLPMREFFAQARQRIPNLGGIKYTHENLDEFQRLLAATEGRHDVLFGRDQMLLAALDAGATAAIGSTYNFAAPLYQQIIQARRQAQRQRAMDLQNNACRMIQACQHAGAAELAALKTVMELAGMPCGPVRPPLRPLNPEQRSRLQHALDAIGFADWCCKHTS